MRFARLRYTIQLQRFAIGNPPVNKFGEPQGQWVTFATVKADKREQGSKEVFEQGAEFNPETLVFITRYRNDLNLKHRVLYNGEPYDIEGVMRKSSNNQGREDLLEIICTVTRADGS